VEVRARAPSIIATLNVSAGIAERHD